MTLNQYSKKIPQKEEHLIGFAFWEVQIKKSAAYKTSANLSEYMKGAKASYDMLMMWHQEHADSWKEELKMVENTSNERLRELETVSAIIMKYLPE